MEKLKVEVSSQRSTGQSGSRKTLILQRQRILFSAFRSDQYSDPEGYLASLGMVLEQYPDDVIVYISDPRTGVQRACKWPPTISEIVEACDRRMQEQARTRRLKNWGKNEVPALEAPREDRPTYEALKEKYGENFGLDPAGAKPPPRKPAPSWDSIAAMYQADPMRLARLIGAADQYAEDRGDAPA
jgi:hypothetical protein